MYAHFKSCFLEINLYMIKINYFSLMFIIEIIF